MFRHRHQSVPMLSRAEPGPQRSLRSSDRTPAPKGQGPRAQTYYIGSVLKPRMPGGCPPRPSALRDRSLVTPLNPHHHHLSDMYKNEAYHPDYGTSPNITKDSSYQPSSANNSHSTNDYPPERRPADHVPSYYYKDYVPVNDLPQTPSTPNDNVFTTTTTSNIPTNRMNGHVVNRASTSSKSESPTDSKKSKTAVSSDKDTPITIPVLNLYGVHSNAAAIGLMSVLSLAMGILGMQLLLTLSGKELSEKTDMKGKLISAAVYESLYEVTVALSSVVMMLNLTCTLICTMQCFFVARLLKLRRGYRRAFRYLKECSAVRLISVTGFFLSIPTFLAALILYCIIKLRSTAAIISTVVIGVGIVLCLVAYVESMVHLTKQRKQADEDTDEDLKNDEKHNPVYGITQNELSTLV